MRKPLPFFSYLRWILLLPWVGALSAGCDELVGTRACTDAYCVSETAMTITRAGVWADGNYALEVRFDGAVHACSFTLPIRGKLPHELQLSGEPFACTPELPGSFRGRAIALYPLPDHDQSCLSASDAGPLEPGAECPPLEGRYHIAIHTTATPDEVELRLTFGTTVLLDQSAAMQYTSIAPNGTECGPVCEMGELDFSIAEPD